MKRSLLALTLTCVFSVSAMAGTIPTCGAPDPPPPGEIHNTDSPAPGDGHTVGDPGEMPGVGLSALLTILDLAF